MIPRDHGFGTSFKGIGQYLLHDEDHANTDERVAWTHCHGLATQNAETGFRVMAACAMDQVRLKQQAHEAAQAALPEDQRKPFRNVGRKDKGSVWHYTLTWSPNIPHP